MMKKIIFLLLLLVQTGFATAKKECCTMTPDAGPRVDCGFNVFLVADYILWTARMDGLAFIQSGISPSGGAVQGSPHHPNWRYSSGFKAGIGGNLPDGWDIFGRYTYLRSRTAKRKIGPPKNPDQELHPTWNIGGEFDENSGFLLELDRAKTNWKLNYNVVDLELGRNFFVSHFMSLRPSLGLKGTWQDQDYFVRYVTFISDEILRLNIDQDYWAVGLRFGLDTTFHLTKKWSFFGEIYASGLWGNFDVTRKDREQNDPDSPEFITLFRENNFYSLKPVLEAFVGFRFDHWFCGNRAHIRFEAGWEEQLWFSHNQYIRIFEEGAHGDLILHGLTLEGRFDF